MGQPAERHLLEANHAVDVERPDGRAGAAAVVQRRRYDHVEAPLVEGEGEVVQTRRQHPVGVRDQHPHTAEGTGAA